MSITSGTSGRLPSGSYAPCPGPAASARVAGQCGQTSGRRRSRSACPAAEVRRPADHRAHIAAVVCSRQGPRPLPLGPCRQVLGDLYFHRSVAIHVVAIHRPRAGSRGAARSRPSAARTAGPISGTARPRGGSRPKRLGTSSLRWRARREPRQRPTPPVLCGSPWARLRHPQERGSRLHLAPPTVWDALFGCVRAARVQVETTCRRVATRERMAVLCRGSND